MRSAVSRRMSPSALFLLTAFITLAITRVAAQDLPTLTISTDNSIPTPSGPDSDAQSSPAPTPSASGSNAASASVSESTSESQLNTESESSITSFSGSSVATTGSPPGLSTGLPVFTNLPTLTGAFNYPAPSVPPTSQAPYMQRSNLPEGTVFIGVGAGLGLFALVIIAWRGLVAWSINRSVRRSATKGYTSVGDSVYDKVDKGRSVFDSSTAPAGSTMSLEKLVPSHRTATSPARNHRDSNNLFFSPTAGAGMHSPGSRSSGYLPSGYYASTSAAPGSAAGDRGSKLFPHSGVYASPRRLDSSPPDSPDVRPSTAGLSTRNSRSSLNLSTMTNDRAPSTYLDDLTSAPPLPLHANVSARPKRDSGGRNLY